MEIKPGVKLLGIRPELLIGADVVESVFKSYGLEAVVTSAIDGKHKRASAHYSGRALDFRIRNISGYAEEGNAARDVQAIFQKIRQKAGENFDVVLESNHIHFEYDPKVSVEG